MSEGPIKRERDAWKPPVVSTTDRHRMCFAKTITTAYCGRHGSKRSTNWDDVTCADCRAARNADEEAAALATLPTGLCGYRDPMTGDACVFTPHVGIGGAHSWEES